MFRKILYPTDFSPDAEIALNYVKKLREAGTEEVVIVHIYDRKKINALWEIKELIELGPANLEKKEVLDKLLKETWTKLKKIERELHDLGFKAEIVVEEGIPAQDICKIAEDLKASLIVLGATGESTFKELLVGSVAMHIVRCSHIPVLVVKNEEKK